MHLQCALVVVVVAEVGRGGGLGQRVILFTALTLFGLGGFDGAVEFAGRLVDHS